MNGFPGFWSKSIIIQAVQGAVYITHILGIDAIHLHAVGGISSKPETAKLYLFPSLWNISQGVGIIDRIDEYLFAA